MQQKTYTKLVLLLLFVFIAFSSFAETKKNLSIALLADVSGIKDYSFNQLIYDGLLETTKKYKNITLKVYVNDGMGNYLQKIDAAIRDKQDIIITSGMLMYDATIQAARNNPQVKFIAIDDEFNKNDMSSNLIGVSFDEYQSGYLAGVFAGAMSVKYSNSIKGLNSDNKIGIIQGMDILPIRRYSDGFRDGVKRSCKECVVVTSLLNSFVDVSKSEKLANSMYADGADILFLLAGRANYGAILSARNYDRYVIGVDDDQNHIDPKIVLTSAVKRLDKAIEKIMDNYMSNSLEFGKNYKFTIKDDSVGIAPFHRFDNLIPNEVKLLINNAKADIVSGKVQSNWYLVNIDSYLCL